MSYIRELGLYDWQIPASTKYVVLNNGKIFRRSDISNDEYDFLNYFGYIVREFWR